MAFPSIYYYSAESECRGHTWHLQMSLFLQPQSFLEAMVDFDDLAVYVGLRLWMGEITGRVYCQWELTLLTVAALKILITIHYVDIKLFFPDLNSPWLRLRTSGSGLEAEYLITPNCQSTYKFVPNEDLKVLASEIFTCPGVLLHTCTIDHRSYWWAGCSRADSAALLISKWPARHKAPNPPCFMSDFQPEKKSLSSGDYTHCFTLLFLFFLNVTVNFHVKTTT